MNENILIAEDDPHMAQQLSILLRQQGYRVAGIAASGESALAQAAQARPDLIIMDSLLEGGVDGIEAAQRISEMHAIPILFLTAHDDEAFFQRVKITQPHAYLLKPPGAHELALAIELARYRHQVEQQQAQEALWRYRAALDSSADAIYLIDRESMRFVDVNETACNTLGYTREELLGLGPQHIKPFFNRDMLAARFDEIISAGQDGVIETEHKRKDDSRFPVEVKLRTTDSGGRRMLVAMARDITDRVEAERTLRESEQRFRQLADNINEVFWIRDVASGNIVYASPAYEQIFDRSLESLYAHPRSFVGMVHPDDRARVAAFVERQHANPGVDELEYRIVGKDGRVRWIWTHAFPVADENGKIYRVAGVSEEVTQRRESEEQYRTIVQSSMDGFWAVDDGGRFLDVNEAYCQLIGYTREELLAMTISDIEAAESSEETEAHIRRIVETGYDRFETRHRRRDGYLLDVEVSVHFTETAEGDRMYVFLRDISAHKRAEQERLAHEAAQRDALVREVHHRIKNNLHGVLGLLRQHAARHPETAVVIEEAINQIGAVAAVHGLQGRHTGDSISLQALLLEITKLARTTIGSGKHPELRISLPEPVSIAAHEVVAVALVLNELLLNAIKHGAADSIPLVALHDGGGKAHIAITNRGAGLPQGFDYEKGLGLGAGLGLVKALMPRKGATLSLRQEDDRIIATMHLDAPVVLLNGRADSEQGA